MYYIAEIGNNHEGDLAAAKELVRAAAESGADAVKFQYIVPERLVTSDQAARIQQLKKFRLSDDSYLTLSELAHSLSLDFFATCFDLESLVFLKRLQRIGKVASSDNNFWDLIEGNLSTFDKVFISTGGMELDDYRTLNSFIKSNQASSAEVVIFHCISSYPTVPADAQLWRLAELPKYFDGLEVGYSDHTLGNSAARVAVAMGARYIEKHFTLDKGFSEFRDHQLSATPHEFKSLVDVCNEAAVLIGDGASDRPEIGMQAIRRKAVAKEAISKGQVFESGNILWLRSDSPEAVNDSRLIYGKNAKRDIPKSSLIIESDLD